MERRPPRHFPIAVAIALLIAFVQVALLSLVLDKLGLTTASASVLLVAMLLGSYFNVPLFSLRVDFTRQQEILQQVFHLAPEVQNLLVPSRMVVAVNIGGCLVPVCLSVYLLLHNPLDPWLVLAAVAIVTAITYAASFPVPSIGVVMPILVAPVTAAIAGLFIDPENAPIVAYIAGTLGVLIGADLLHLHEVRRIGGPFASIGGAGTFDGIFLTGIIAALLA